MTYISSAQVDGLTGPISFTEGKRTDFKLDLLKLEHDKMQKVGDWNPIQGLNITDPYAFLQGKSIFLFLQLILFCIKKGWRESSKFKE